MINPPDPGITADINRVADTLKLIAPSPTVAGLQTAIADLQDVLLRMTTMAGSETAEAINPPDGG